MKMRAFFINEFFFVRELREFTRISRNSRTKIRTDATTSSNGRNR
jgi:hypothetical protein